MNRYAQHLNKTGRTFRLSAKITDFSAFAPNGYGWFNKSPILTEVVDDYLFGTFKAAGPRDDADARHLMYAVHNRCDRFVTTDPHFLDRRPELEKSCHGLRIVKPTELVSELVLDPT